MSRAVEKRSVVGTLVFGTGNRKKAAELAVLAQQGRERAEALKDQ